MCVCGKTASCASLQVSPLHHLIKGAEKQKKQQENNHQELKYQQLSGPSLQLQTDLIKIENQQNELHKKQSHIKLLSFTLCFLYIVAIGSTSQNKVYRTLYP